MATIEYTLTDKEKQNLQEGDCVWLAAFDEGDIHEPRCVFEITDVADKSDPSLATYSGCIDEEFLEEGDDGCRDVGWDQIESLISRA